MAAVVEVVVVAALVVIVEVVVCGGRQEDDHVCERCNYGNGYFVMGRCRCCYRWALW